MKNSVGISLQLWKKTCRCVEIQNRTCLVHEFKHDCTTVLSTTWIGNHASKYKKKRLSKINNKNVCWLLLSFTCSCIILFLFVFFCKAHVVVEWKCVLIDEYLPCLIHFLAFFFVPDSCSSFHLYLHDHNFSMLVNFLECIY